MAALSALCLSRLISLGTDLTVEHDGYTQHF